LPAERDGKERPVQTTGGSTKPRKTNLHMSRGKGKKVQEKNLGSRPCAERKQGNHAVDQGGGGGGVCGKSFGSELTGTHGKKNAESTVNRGGNRGTTTFCSKKERTPSPIREHLKHEKKRG